MSDAVIGPPAPPIPEIARLVGQYGAPGAVLDVFERDGRLYTSRLGLDDTEVARAPTQAASELSVDLVFESGAPAAWARLKGTLLERHDFGAEAVAAFREALNATSPGDRYDGSAPSRKGARPSQLVNLRSLDSSLRFDIRYAGSNNFMGRPLYDRPAAYLQRPAAEALARVQAALRADGYGLVVHDAYRPWSVTRLFWEVVPDAYRMFVADPREGSKHNCGCAVDVAFFENARGALAEMPSDYDEPTERSRADYEGGTSRQRWMRDRLRRAMEAEDFTVHPLEWWHFDHATAGDYAAEDFRFDELEG